MPPIAHPTLGPWGGIFWTWTNAQRGRTVDWAVWGGTFRDHNSQQRAPWTRTTPTSTWDRSSFLLQSLREETMQGRRQQNNVQVLDCYPEVWRFKNPWDTEERVSLGKEIQLPLYKTSVWSLPVSECQLLEVLSRVLNQETALQMLCLDAPLWAETWPNISLAGAANCRIRLLINCRFLILMFSREHL